MPDDHGSNVSRVMAPQPLRAVRRRGRVKAKTAGWRDACCRIIERDGARALAEAKSALRALGHKAMHVVADDAALVMGDDENRLGDTRPDASAREDGGEPESASGGDHQNCAPRTVRRWSCEGDRARL